MAKTVSQKTAKKIGLIVAINMLIGSIIGVGIFFKNDNIFATNGSNPISILIAWVIAAVISLFTALSFAEVSSCDISHSGLGGWCTNLIGKKFGGFIKIIQPLFYFSILLFSISIFSSESIFNIFDASESFNVSIVFLVGLCLFLFFLFFNFVSVKYSGWLQMVISFFKFAPLLVVMITGIIHGNLHPSDNLFNNQTNQTFGSINAVGILVSLPAILFAFDSFVSIGNLSKDMTNPQKNVPLAVIIAMILVGIFYILVTLGQIFSNSGNIYELFNKVITDMNARNIVRIILSILICISVIGVLNSFSLVAIRSCNSLVEDNTIVCGKQLEKIANQIIPTNNPYKPGVLIAILFYLVWFISLIIPSSILNTDAYVDGISNFPTTFFFAVYATVILFGLINRWSNKVKVNKVKGFIFFAPIAVIGCYLVFFFQFFYTFTTATIIDPNKEIFWGLFSTNDYVVKNWQATILFFIYLIFMIFYFIINKVMIKKSNSRNVKSFRLDVIHA